MVNDLKIFFDHSALRELHKTENKQVTVRDGDEPQQYVTRKLAILKQMDKNMNE